MRYLRKQPLKKHCSIKIGGPADYFCQPKNVSDLKDAIMFAHEKKLPIMILGAGSNLLFCDEGFKGLVIKLVKGLDWVRVVRTKVTVGSGVLLSKLLSNLIKNKLGGLEFLVGIPGTIGGAVVMNAGAWSKEIGQFVDSIKVLDKSGKEKVFKRKNLGFAYRRSVLQKNDFVVTEVSLRLRKSKKSVILKKIKEFMERRKGRQPLGIPNSGSVFKNPKGAFAGKLIEEAGCKGLRVGDAQVSEKHANFIVNLGEAKASDVIKLMSRVQKAVKIKLEPEIVII
ncbi:MAG: UDP-N-acetylmuramate dehydrogenase [Candidatus Margulisbacteria bacterium]|nr:UDP-N-acetylmuramate dehydrogenase [Candidatus Margulisiibacteriota bacterium]